VRDRKPADEALAAAQIADEYPDFPWVIDTYRSYEKLDTPEKRFVYALDKLYPHILILIGDHHPVHPSWEKYFETEQVAKEKIARTFPPLLPLFDDLCARFRQKPHFFSTPIAEEYN
jgi:hypothetical protein